MAAGLAETGPRELCLPARQALRQSGAHGLTATTRSETEEGRPHSRDHRIAALGRRTYAEASAQSAP